MEYRILGPLEVCDGERSLALGGAKQRSLLAVLLLHRGEVVSSERLIDALWGERPPPTAAKSVQVYVSHLRRLLGDGRLVTRQGGYALEIEAGALDGERFEELVAAGRRLLASDDPRGARDALVQALALWRGPALQDFAYEAFAATDIARLEELRLGALEERLDAELALGRHAELVAELQALVREHPLRERLRGQLMLALYRSGRQAEALESYQEARRVLVDELGLEPGHDLRDLEQAILRQDAALGRSGRAPPALLRKLPRGRWLAAAGAAVVAAAAVAALVAHGGGTEERAVLSPDALGAIDPASGRLMGALHVAGAPDRLAGAGATLWAVSEGARTLWAVSEGARTIQAIDTRRRSPTGEVNPGGSPHDVAVGTGGVWGIDERAGELMQIDPYYYAVVHRVTLHAPAHPASLMVNRSFDSWSLAVGAGAVWVTDGTSLLTRVDPRTRHATLIPVHRPLDGLTVADGAVWAISERRSEVVRIDPRQPTKPTIIPIVGAHNAFSPDPVAIEAGLGSVWVLNGNTATVTRIDPRQRGIVDTISIGIEHSPVRLAVGAGAVWVANADGTLARIDPATDRPTFTIVGHRLNDVEVVGTSVWVSGGAGAGATLSAPRAPTSASAGPKVTALPSATCSPLYYRPGDRPRLLVASQFPLQAPNQQQGLQISEAVGFVLARHGFRAGPYPIAYQACDASTPTPDLGFDFLSKCAPSARTYARDRSLVALIGPFVSDCTKLELPVLNRAAGGPIAEISPSSTYAGFTHTGPGVAADEPARYARSGRRSFVRVIAPDDVQAAADAIVAHDVGVHRLVIVGGQDSAYGRGIVADLRRAAVRLGVRVVGWIPVTSARTVARRVGARRADGVFLAGYYLEFQVHTLLPALRRALPANGKLLAGDGFFNADLVRSAGRAGEGLTISFPGVAVERLRGAGARFAREFGAAIGERPDPYAVRAAQAAEVLLKAIARSDGTRGSVLRELFATRVKNGILGSFAVTPTGDITARPVTIYRITHSALRVTRVIDPPASLVG